MNEIGMRKEVDVYFKNDATWRRLTVKQVVVDRRLAPI